MSSFKGFNNDLSTESANCDPMSRWYGTLAIQFAAGPCGGTRLSWRAKSGMPVAAITESTVCSGAGLAKNSRSDFPSDAIKLP
jgi:hypothetical protein